MIRQEIIGLWFIWAFFFHVAGNVPEFRPVDRVNDTISEAKFNAGRLEKYYKKPTVQDKKIIKFIIISIDF